MTHPPDDWVDILRVVNLSMCVMCGYYLLHYARVCHTVWDERSHEGWLIWIIWVAAAAIFSVSGIVTDQPVTIRPFVISIAMLITARAIVIKKVWACPNA
jgi:hypothetical protein